MDPSRPKHVRAVRQRLEALKRAGLDRIPIPIALAASAPAPALPRAEPARAVAAPPPPSTAASLFDTAPPDGPVLSIVERAQVLQALAEQVAVCVRCAELAATRTQTVFGVGRPDAALMFIGEAPGADEDRRGEPFVGRAGQLLTDMITKGMGLRREDVYIANILKCRPPNNRDPDPTEAANCIGYLEQQIATVRPQFLCLLGRIAAQRLLDTALPMNRLRGRWHTCRGIRTIVTYHPAALLRNPAWKKEAWEDLKMLMRAMGLKVPSERKPAGN